ncbi:MAG: hypothetical protein U0X39_05780 [Bacteroidales bacterium]
MKTIKFLSVIVAFLLIGSCTKKAEQLDSLPPDAVLTADTSYISKDGSAGSKSYDYFHELMTYDYASGTWFASWGVSYQNNTRLTFSGPAPEDIDPWEQPYFELTAVQNGTGTWLSTNSWSISYNIAPVGSTQIPVRTEQTTIHKWVLGNEILYDILIHYRYTYTYPSFVTYTSSCKVYKIYNDFYLVNIDFTPPGNEE